MYLPPLKFFNHKIQRFYRASYFPTLKNNYLLNLRLNQQTLNITSFFKTQLLIDQRYDNHSFERFLRYFRILSIIFFVVSLQIWSTKQFLKQITKEIQLIVIKWYLKHMKTSHARANSAMYKYLDKKEIRNLNYYHIVHSILISVPWKYFET